MNPFDEPDNFLTNHTPVHTLSNHPNHFSNSNNFSSDFDSSRTVRTESNPVDFNLTALDNSNNSHSNLSFNNPMPPYISPTITLADEIKSLINEIESSHISCSALIRKIRDSQVIGGSGLNETHTSSIHQQLLPKLLNSIEEKAKEKSKAIESLCHHEYQGFSELLTQLIQMKNSFNDIRQKLASICLDVSQTTKSLLQNCEELSSAQEKVNNVDMAIDSLQICLPILDQFSRVKRNIAELRFFPALKLLGSLEHSQLPLIKRYDFSLGLEKQIPIIRSQIRSLSERQCKDFLENVRKNSIHIGAMTMSVVEEKIKMHFGIGTLVSGDEPYHKPSTYPYVDMLEKDFEMAQLNASKITHVNATRKDDKINDANKDSKSLYMRQNIEDMVDFIPLYRCLHIRSVLGERVEFEEYYRKQRKRQWDLLLLVRQSIQLSMRNYSEFFSGIVGFFVIEEYIYQTVQNLVLRSDLDEMWSNTTSRVIEIFSNNVGAVNNRQVLLQIKESSVLFLRTMEYLLPGQNYALSGHDSGCLKPLIDLVRDRYYQLLIDEWTVEFKKICAEDDYSSILVRDSAHLSELLDMYPGCECGSSLPFRLHFSMLVPRLFKLLKSYIDQCAQFSTHLSEHSVTEHQDNLFQATGQIFSTKNGLGLCLSEMVKSAGENFHQLVQLSVNMEELEVASSRLEQYIKSILSSNSNDAFEFSSLTEVKYAGPEESNYDLVSVSMAPTLISQSNHQPVKMSGLSLFQEIKSEAESQIYSTIHSKIDNFFSLANYEWQKIPAPDEKIVPSTYIVDVVGFLGATFQSADNIPPKVAQTVWLSSCNYVSQELVKLLQSPSVKAISEHCLSQLSVDLSVCESFAKRDIVTGLDREKYIVPFIDLRQLLDLLIKEDFHTYLSLFGRADSPYERVSPSSVIKVLEKLKEGEKKGSGFFQGMRKNDRDRRKKYDTIISQIKDLHQSIYSRT